MMASRREFLKYMSTGSAGLLLGLRQSGLVGAQFEGLHMLTKPYNDPCEVRNAAGELLSSAARIDVEAHSHPSGQADGQMILELNGVVNTFWFEELVQIRYSEPTGSVWRGRSLSVRGRERDWGYFAVTVTSPFTDPFGSVSDPIYQIVGDCVLDGLDAPGTPPGPVVYICTNFRARHFFKIIRE